MRWVLKEKLKKVDPAIGSTKVVTKFLYFPKTLRNNITKKLEKRWLEKATIHQEYNVVGCYMTDGGGSYYGGWVDVYFME